MKCENCKEERIITEIENYTIVYEGTYSYNCCCEECAKACATSDGIRQDEIIKIEK